MQNGAHTSDGEGGHEKDDQSQVQTRGVIAERPASLSSTNAGGARGLTITGGEENRTMTAPQRPFTTVNLSSPISPVSPSSLPLPVTTTPPFPSSSTLDSFKAWSVKTIVCTKQIVSEKLGRASKTVDTELDHQIETLRNNQRQYEEMHKQARSLAVNFVSVVTCQRALADTFRELSQKIPELHQQFELNADTTKRIYKKGEVLLSDLNFFTSNLATLCDKTIEDTLLTVKQYESARVEYDAYRTSLEDLLRNGAGPRAEEAQRDLAVRKEKFEQMRNDVTIKIRLVNGNKTKVMHKQLLLFHNAVTAYFTENQSAMIDSQQRFRNIKQQPADIAITGEDI